MKFKYIGGPRDGQTLYLADPPDLETGHHTWDADLKPHGVSEVYSVHLGYVPGKTSTGDKYDGAAIYRGRFEDVEEIVRLFGGYGPQYNP